MLKVPCPNLPSSMPLGAAMASHGQNSHDYEPEFWEFQYELSRYLANLSTPALTERYRGIVRNMEYIVRSENHSVPINSYLGSWYWFRKEYQTRLEFHMRGLQPPQGVTLPGDVTNHPIAGALRSHAQATRIVFRYARREYNEAGLTRGVFRLCAASNYRQDVNAARCDDELQKTSMMDGTNTHIVTGDGRHLPVKGDVRRVKTAPDYYVLCTSSALSRGLFTEFGADSCLVVRDVAPFAERLSRAIDAEQTGLYGLHAPVQYYDPHETSRRQFLDAGISKDFRFAYQQEYRFLWMPLDGSEIKRFLTVEIGSLAQIATLTDCEALQTGETG